MSNQEKAVTHSDQQVPEKKQTSLGLYVTAQQAYEMWKAEPEPQNADPDQVWSAGLCEASSHG